MFFTNCFIAGLQSDDEKVYRIKWQTWRIKKYEYIILYDLIELIDYLLIFVWSEFLIFNLY